MSAEVLEPAGGPVAEQGLGALAATVNQEHAAAERAAGSALAHAVASGGALVEAQRRVPAGQWLLWVDRNVEVSRARAQVYMRLAVHRSVLDASLSVTGAVATLAGLPSVGQGGRYPPVREEVRQAACQLRAEGQPVSVIAERFGVSIGTIYRWVDPAARERAVTAARLAHRRQGVALIALREQERQREIKRAVRKAGAAVAELYAMTERQQDVIAQAHRETTDTEARRELSLIGEDHRRMRDRIVRVLGITT